ncbi:NADPH-dependent 7-cyano-7-deazaguanine reductase QueF [Anaerophaga thermohalophila]|uniref:NADPH-dependent 7-cyano-7-deazaguanine reductase QueF n=1 Tax=Anaerophaga thermohalophila TaxID=177400 RepID=UPI000237CA6B|nr:NADPH-dependent 7-cyano-7-deazaguanine reductase QueF [Anaerophaga thermohalophila]
MNEAKFLGKPTEYPKHYAPEVLVTVPRQPNRKEYGLKENTLPFTGYDVWHAYEVSFLTGKGLPVTGLLKLIYPASSPYIVESKSLKLYLNSFNMERFGSNAKEASETVHNIIRQDLERVLKTTVNIHFFPKSPKKYFDFGEFGILEEIPEIEKVTFSEYREAPHLLKPDHQQTGNVIKAGTHLLRSNCKVTFQPDWGSAFIYIKGTHIPDRTGLLKYLVSIRNENHFHEEICEMIYKRLWDRFTPDQLMVACIYTRRGGIDICPARASHHELLPTNLITPDKLTKKLLRQ